jgi:TetR/AcrR family transcriptional regulator, transcriptional repressor for nem operon
LLLYDGHNIKLSRTILKEGDMVRYQKDRHEQTHKAIVEASSILLREKGFTETSVGAVMKAVGLTHGGFYAHFDDKTAMLVAAMQEALVQSPKNFKCLSDLATSKNDVGLIAKHYLADGRVNDVATGCPAAALVSELPRQPSAVQDAFHHGAVATVEAIAEAPGLSRDGWAAFSMLVGGLTLMRAIPDQKTNSTIRSQIIAALRKLSRQDEEK